MGSLKNSKYYISRRIKMMFKFAPSSSSETAPSELSPETSLTPSTNWTSTDAGATSTITLDEVKVPQSTKSMDSVKLSEMDTNAPSSPPKPPVNLVSHGKSPTTQEPELVSTSETLATP